MHSNPLGCRGQIRVSALAVGNLRATANAAHNRETMRKTLAERFEEYVERIPFSSCWYWTGGTDKDGYGKFWAKPQTQRAHRVSWLISHRTDSKMRVLHSCDTPSCVNPAHLFEGTQKDNIQDAIRKGRRPAMPKHIAELNEQRRLRAAS